MNLKKSLIKLTSFCLAFGMISVTYQNCGSPDANNGGAVSSSADNGDIIPIPNTKTASIQRASRVLDNLVSCLGTGEPSNDARDAWQNNRGTISEEGLANSMTQPMAKALVSISAEVCDDLMNQERSLDVDQRRIFLEIDFDNGGVARSDLGLAAKRLARSCWGRNATDDELGMIISNIDSNFSSGEDNRDTTRLKAVYLCTAMAASFSTFEM